MLSTESRMRGDMQVRFGGRYGKTYCRKAVRRSVPSLRLGKGGGIIELAAHLYATDHVPYLLERIAEQTPHVHPVSFFYGTHALPISICVPVIRSNSRLYLVIRFSSNTFSSIPTLSGL